MTYTMRVSLVGNDAGTTTDIDKFSVYADSDNILIKEKTRGTVTVDPTSNGTVAHGLSYIPYFIAISDSSGTKTTLSGGELSTDLPFSVQADTTDIVFRNSSAGTIDFQYFIFHDQQV